MTKKGAVMKQNGIWVLVALSLLFCVTSVFGQGFGAGTLVKIPDGYIPIEQIQVGDYVLSYSDGQYVSCAVLRTLSVREPQHYCLQVQDDTIYLSERQKLYIPGENRWTAAQDIKPSDVLACGGVACSADEPVYVVHHEIQLYDLIVEGEHTFCVSWHDIVVHNFEPISISIGLTFLIGAGAIEFVGATIATTLVGLGVGLAWQNNKDGKKEVALKVGPDADSVVGSGGSPEDPEEDNFFEKLKSRAKKVVRTNKFGKFYEDPNTKLWWSKDRANHGGSQFKVFRKVKRGLEWIYDASLNGSRIMSKHKGPIGLFIPNREIVPCQ
jgi:hypothetical protein